VNYKSIIDILGNVKNGSISPEDAFDKLSLEQYKDIEIALLDYQRPLRTGFPEAIYSKGKTSEQLLKIFHRLYEDNKPILLTKMRDDHINAFQTLNYPDVRLYKEVGILTANTVPKEERLGNIVVASGGTSDYFVSEESAIISEALGSNVVRLYDVGIAGLHRLISKLDKLVKANVIIAVAGMEGALPSVIAGLVKAPVIAIPTSVGYGASFSGVSALLTMLNSCAPGISVVNIDNGFGAAYQANLINILIETKNHMK
jgi:pyridinium-3,5-biscarboxylic acid mononucleotide synthase